MTIRKPIITITYNSRDITNDISSSLISLRYKDKISADSPDIDLVLEDREQLFQNEWFPGAKDKISLSFKYEQEQTEIVAEDFEIDQLEFNFSLRGDRITIKAQQTPFSKTLREKKSEEYENVSLKEIFELVASRQGLTIVGTVADIQFERITQNEQSDLEFVTRLAQDYGNLVKIEGDQLIVYSWDELNSQPADFNISRTNIEYFRGRKKLEGTYKDAKIVYEKPDDETTIEFQVLANPQNDSEDTLTINDRSETVAQAEAKAKEKLRKANADEWSGEFRSEGEYWHKAGVNLNVSDFGRFDGVWQIQEVEHSFSSQNGWTAIARIHKLN